jgi:hypothetical protein
MPRPRKTNVRLTPVALRTSASRWAIGLRSGTFENAPSLFKVCTPTGYRKTLVDERSAILRALADPAVGIVQRVRGEVRLRVIAREMYEKRFDRFEPED